MKRNVTLALLLACVAAGALRLLDLCLFTQPETGFVTLGSVWLRYGVLALLFVAIQAAALLHKEDAAPVALHVSAPVLWVLVAIAAAVSSLAALLYAVAQFSMPTTNFGLALGEGGSSMLLGVALLLRLTVALSLLVFCGFAALMAARSAPLAWEASGTRLAGLFGCLGFFILPVLRYVENPASVHRILIILPIFSAVLALVFVVKLVGTLCASISANTLAAAGLSAFLLCTCIELPQTIWQAVQGGATLLQISLSVLLGL